jgi:N-acetyl-anhydromuramyl-L-alanine amidase AmpD
VERLLQDRHVGWHAGDWEVNRASVGICLAGDYSRQRPTAAALAALRGVLARYPGATLMLHREVNCATDCPGPWASAGELARACA